MRRESLALVATILTLGGVAHASAGDKLSSDPRDWPMYNHDVEGTRNAQGEHHLRPHDVSDLDALWSFSTSGVVAGTPAVVDDIIYAGDGTGVMYALTRDGDLVWSTSLGIPISASALVTSDHVIIGDLGGFIHGLDRRTGAVEWTVRPNAHPLASVLGSATMVGHNVAIGIASTEVQAAADPNYTCCSARGMVVMLDPSDGHTVWKFDTVSDAEAAEGSSGAPVWSTPTYDETTDTLYITTGNNYSQPTTSRSDSIIALEASTGAVKWVNQRTPNDEWTLRFVPYSPEHPDADLGDSPQIYRLPGGRKVVGSGQKSGFYHVVDATTGEIVNFEQFEPGGLFGGLFADSAIDGHVVFANGVDWPGYPFDPPVGGDLIAFSSDATTELWRFSTPGSPNMAGVAVANGVVYFQSAFAGILYALDAGSGAELAAVPVGQGMSGPSISRGQVYVGVGNPLNGFDQPGAIVALGIPKHHH